MLDAFHAGEIEIQDRVGERDAAIMNGRLMGDSIPAPARHFVTQQHYVLLGWADPAGALWATFLAGPQGFAQTDEARKTLTLALDDPAGTLRAIPPLASLGTGDHLGALFIELGTRRRLRVNGRAAALTDGGLTIDIERAYPLCPKYIQRRRLEERAHAPADAGVSTGKSLDETLAAWIAGADTFFVASAHPDGPADVSHRGGGRVSRGCATACCACPTIRAIRCSTRSAISLSIRAPGWCSWTSSRTASCS